ncbi:MAG TPA: Gfo/Idh/MocA family oxidoreductase [Chloroflexota bacterium]|nr:Gfo/Idh/MocA family oxidoreductase [Chloroflexota bacterium]
MADVSGTGGRFEVGLVVAGHPHTTQHLDTLRSLEVVEGIHLCTLGGDDLEPLTRAAGSKARPAAPDLEALLARPEVDTLLVAVRNDLSVDVLERAVRAGKGALFEKPGATSAASLRAVAGAARARGLTLGAILPWRYHPISREIRDLIQQGALGRLLAVEARMVTSQVRYRRPEHWLFKRQQAGSGILSWLAVHWIDLLGFLCGQRVAAVTALTANRNPEPIEVEDTACLALRYQDGTLGTLHAGYLLPGSASGYAGAAYDNYLAIRGYDGWVSWPHTSPPSYTCFSTAPGWAAAGRQERRFDPPPLQAYGGMHGLHFVRDFLHAARAGRPAPCPIEDAVHALEVVEAALEAAASGRTVTLEAT